MAALLSQGQGAQAIGAHGEQLAAADRTVQQSTAQCTAPQQTANWMLLCARIPVVVSTLSAEPQLAASLNCWLWLCAAGAAGHRRLLQAADDHPQRSQSSLSRIRRSCSMAGAKQQHRVA